MEFGSENEDPWPKLVKFLTHKLNSVELHSIMDCLRDRFTGNEGRDWRKKIEDQTDCAEKVRTFVDYIEEQTDQRGFLTLMLKVSEQKQLNFKTKEGMSVTLKECLLQVKERMKRYEAYCQEHQMLKGSNFIGREEEMKSLSDVLLRGSGEVAGTWLSGMGGTGKTTLANQVLGNQSTYQKRYVDLKMVNDIEDLYNRLAAVLDIPPLQQDQKLCWETIYEEVDEMKLGCVLFLDSFETLLSPNNTDNQKKKIWEILRNLVSRKNPKVKLLIVSVHALEDCLQDQHPIENLVDVKLEPFNLEKCQELVRKVAPKIFREANPKDVEFIVHRLCGFNTLAVQAVFNYLHDNSDCITVKQFLKDCKQALSFAENNSQETSRVIQTLGRVFDGQKEDMQAALVKLSTCSGLQFDFSMAKACLSAEDSSSNDTIPVTMLKTLVKAHLLQMEVKSRSTGMEQADRNIYENQNTRYFLHSLFQQLVEKRRCEQYFGPHIQSVESKLRVYIKNRLLEVGEDKSCQVVGLEPELQPLVVKHCSAPSIDDDPVSYNQANNFNAALQRYLNPKNLKKFYNDEAKRAKRGGDVLKWIFVELSNVEVLLNGRSSLKNAEKKLCAVATEIDRLKSTPAFTACKSLELTEARFNVVKGRYLGLCRNFDEAELSINEAITVYGKNESCRREHAKALNSKGAIYSLRPVEEYTVREALKYNQEACEIMGEKLHFDVVLYSMDVGTKALVLGNMAKDKIQDVTKKRADLPEEEVQRYHQDEKRYLNMARDSFQRSIELCEKLKMKRSLQYIEVLRNKALLLTGDSDIKSRNGAVESAIKAYELMKEYDEENKAQMAMCCFTIGQAYKELAAKMFTKHETWGSDEENAYFDRLQDAYDKFIEGYKLVKEGKVMADLQDFYGWRDSLRQTMKYLGMPGKEIDSMALDIEVYIKKDIREREKNVRKMSAPARLIGESKRKETLEHPGRRRAQTQVTDSSNPMTVHRTRKRHSVDLLEEAAMVRKRRPGVTEQPKDMDVTSHDSGPSQAYLDHKRHSVSDDIAHLGQLDLGGTAMQPCPEEPTKSGGLFSKLWPPWGRSKQTEAKMMDQLQLPVTKEQSDVSDRSSVSSLSSKDSALTGYSKHLSFSSKSSASLEMDGHEKQNSPIRSVKKQKFHASVSHSFLPGNIPDIRITNVTDEGMDVSEPPQGWLPLQQSNTKSKVKKWLGFDTGSRPSSPGGSSDESYHSAMDVHV